MTRPKPVSVKVAVTEPVADALALKITSLFLPLSKDKTVPDKPVPETATPGYSPSFDGTCRRFEPFCVKTVLVMVAVAAKIV